MTAAWYDLGQRLYAAQSGRPADRLAHAPFPRVSRPVAVRARQRGPAITVTAAAPGAPEQAASGSEALTLLRDLGVTMTAGSFRTLLTDDTVTLPALVALARTAGRAGDAAGTAAHIAWWADRADYPGSAAVVPLVAACQQRWITGEAPAAERRARTWRGWLGVTDSSCGGMMALLDRLQDTPALTLLDVIDRDDAGSWSRAALAHAAGRDWRRPDTPGRAAVGLQSRCDAADLFAAALLADPLFRRRAAHTGHVVTGIAQDVVTGRRASRDVPGRPASLSVTCDRLDARLRNGDDITGWAGEPGGTPTDPFRGTVTDPAVRGGVLILTITGVRGKLPASGSRITLHPAAPAPYTYTSGRHCMIRLYSRRGSWLTTGRPPARQRRDVPLEVLIAAADQPAGH